MLSNKKDPGAETPGPTTGTCKAWGPYEYQYKRLYANCNILFEVFWVN